MEDSIKSSLVLTEVESTKKVPHYEMSLGDLVVEYIVSRKGISRETVENDIRSFIPLESIHFLHNQVRNKGKVVLDTEYKRTLVAAAFELQSRVAADHDSLKQKRYQRSQEATQMHEEYEIRMRNILSEPFNNSENQVYAHLLSADARKLLFGVEQPPRNPKLNLLIHIVGCFVDMYQSIKPQRIINLWQDVIAPKVDTEVRLYDVWNVFLDTNLIHLTSIDNFILRKLWDDSTIYKSIEEMKHHKSNLEAINEEIFNVDESRRSNSTDLVEVLERYHCALFFRRLGENITNTIIPSQLRQHSNRIKQIEHYSKPLVLNTVHRERQELMTKIIEKWVKDDEVIDDFIINLEIPFINIEFATHLDPKYYRRTAYKLPNGLNWEDIASITYFDYSSQKGKGGSRHYAGALGFDIDIYASPWLFEYEMTSKDISFWGSLSFKETMEHELVHLLFNKIEKENSVDKQTVLRRIIQETGFTREELLNHSILIEYSSTSLMFRSDEEVMEEFLCELWRRRTPIHMLLWAPTVTKENEVGKLLYLLNSGDFDQFAVK